MRMIKYTKQDIIKLYSIEISKLKRDYIKNPLIISPNGHNSEIPFVEDLAYLFITLNIRRDHLEIFFGCSRHPINRWCKIYNIVKSKNMRNKNSSITKRDKGLDTRYLKSIKNKRDATNLKKHGHINVGCFGSPEHIKAVILNKKENRDYTKNIILKRQRTKKIKYGDKNFGCFGSKSFEKAMVEHYGTPHCMQVKSIKEKVKRTKLNRYGDAHYNNIKQTKKTNLQKYGREFYSQTNNFHNLWSDKNFVNSIKQKEYYTKKRNGTFKTSKIENKIHTLLLSKYLDVIHSYRSSKYPFNCDFYIPSLDLYIEYQGSWHHGAEPFNECNPKHLKIVNRWKEKAEELNFKGEKKVSYLSAITIWTVRDPLKRKTAKDNKLNWLEFFNLKDFMNWYNNI